MNVPVTVVVPMTVVTVYVCEDMTLDDPETEQVSAFHTSPSGS